MEIGRGSHVVYSLNVHLVFVTKRRGRVFSQNHLAWLNEIFAEICENNGCKLSEFNGESEHVHLLIFYPPKVQLSVLVKALKGISSYVMKREFSELSEFWSVRKSKGALWTRSYFAGSVGGAPISILRQYIEEQGVGRKAAGATSPH